nr:hypothetical protein [Tanacetum cinerariifolium]
MNKEDSKKKGKDVFNLVDNVGPVPISNESIAFDASTSPSDIPPNLGPFENVFELTNGGIIDGNCVKRIMGIWVKLMEQCLKRKTILHTSTICRDSAMVILSNMHGIMYMVSCHTCITRSSPEGRISWNDDDDVLDALGLDSRLYED